MTKTAAAGRVFAALLAAVLLMLLPVGASAQGSTLLTTEVPETVELRIELSGKGSAVINGQGYSSSQMIELPRPGENSLSISPASGYKLSYIRLDGKDLSTELKDGKLVFQSPVLPAVLELGFVPLGTQPATGDSLAAPLLCSLCMLLSAVSLFTLKKRI